MTKELYVPNRTDWRKWLSKNYATEKEIWLIYYKKNSGRPSIPYEDSVEEALCFGWVDSIVKKMDDEKYVRKFTPRKDDSRWSESNKKRALRMIREGRMTEAGMALIQEAKQNGEWSKAPAEKRELEIPPFFKDALAKNKKATDYFNTLAPTYKRNFVGWVSSAKREETRMKRLAEALSYLEQNKKLPLK